MPTQYWGPWLAKIRRGGPVAIGVDVLSNSWFCLVKLPLGRFGPRPGDG